VVPASLQAERAGMGRSNQLFDSAQHRIRIWGETADRFLEKPIGGWGLNNARAIPAENPATHPHNALLQILVELGSVGAALAAAVVLLVLAGTARLAPSAQRFALPAFAAGLCVASLAFGLWQSWWTATLALGALIFPLLGRD
jgi:O-antigen ligase